MSSMLSDQAVDMLWMISTGQLQNAAAKKYPGGAALLGRPQQSVSIGEPEMMRGGTADASIGEPEIMRNGTADASIGEPEVVGTGLDPREADVAYGGFMPQEEHQGSGDAIHPSALQLEDLIGIGGLGKALLSHLGETFGKKAAEEALTKFTTSFAPPAAKDLAVPGVRAAESMTGPSKVGGDAVVDFVREGQRARHINYINKQAADLQPGIDKLATHAESAESGELGGQDLIDSIFKENGSSFSGADAVTKPGR